MTALGRIGLIISGFLFAGMVLFTLSGYERISRAYADINALNSEIDSTSLRINELDVQIECAVTIQDAQQVAVDLVEFARAGRHGVLRSGGMAVILPEC